MPPLSISKKPVQWEFLGIDPGVNGGIARISPTEGVILTKTPMTEQDLWRYFESFNQAGVDVVAAVEEIDPRPTRWFNKKMGQWQSSILKSTCQIYASYIQARAMLTAASIRFETVRPQKWQKRLGIKQRQKGESDSEWKNRLRGHAQRLQPKAKITLYTADALLVAEYLKSVYTGQ